MPKPILLFVCLLAAAASLAPAQTALEPSKMHERVIAIVPMVGSGTFNDPIRPMFAPRFNSDAVNDDINRKGGEKAFKDFADQILEYTYTPSDDGKYAIVEFVARDRKTFAPLLNSGRSDIRLFVKGKNSKAEIETEVKKVKKNFDASEFSGRARSAGIREVTAHEILTPPAGFVKSACCPPPVRQLTFTTFATISLAPT